MKNGRPQWRARVRVGGVLQARFFDRMDEARHAEAEMLREAKTLGDGAPKKGKHTTYSDHWAAYLKDGCSGEKPSTLASKKGIYQTHLGPAFGETKLGKIDVRAIDSLRASLLANRSPKTCNNVLSVFRDSLQWAVRWGLLTKVPEIEWAKKRTPEFRFLDFEETPALVEASKSDPLTHTMVVVGLHAGLRIGELRALRWVDVDLRSSKLHVRQSAWKMIVGLPKSGKPRTLPLTSTAREALRAHQHLKGELVFSDREGKMLAYSTTLDALTRATKRAKLVGIGWHTLRHTFASHLVMRGVSIKAVQELLGHADLKDTMRYAHLSPSHIDGAVLVLDQPVANTAASEVHLRVSQTPEKGAAAP